MQPYLSLYQQEFMIYFITIEGHDHWLVVQQTSGYKINVTEAKEIKGGCIKCLLTTCASSPNKKKHV